MKKKKFSRKLSLNKTTISNLNSKEMNRVNAGEAGFTAGCTDGTVCSDLGACSEWNCTDADCTADPCAVRTYTCNPVDLMK
jgi:hypothetical protein